jgi:hypothetical protein
MMDEVTYAIRKAQRTIIMPDEPPWPPRVKKATQIIPVCIICKARLSETDDKEGKALCRDCEKVMEAPYPPADDDTRKGRYPGWQRYRQNRNRKSDSR